MLFFILARQALLNAPFADPGPAAEASLTTGTVEILKSFYRGRPLFMLSLFYFAANCPQLCRPNTDKFAMYEYDLKFPDGRSVTCGIDPQRIDGNPEPDSSHWCQLSFQQCSNCPLKAAEGTQCPLAVDVKQVLSGFEPILLQEGEETHVDAVVKTPSRWYFKSLPFKEALRSLFDYLALTSQCPIMRGNQWKRRFYVPFTDAKESAFLEFGHEILSFMDSHGATDDKQKIVNLRRKNAEHNMVHTDFLERLRIASVEDAILGQWIPYLEVIYAEKSDTFDLAIEIGQIIKKAG